MWENKLCLGLMQTIASNVNNCLSNLLYDVLKAHYQKKLDEHKLKTSICDYITRQKKYHELCSSAEEYDLVGILEFIHKYHLKTVDTRIFSPNSNKRNQARIEIENAAVSYAKATTSESKKRVSKIVSTCIDICREYYKNSISIDNYVLAAEITDAITENTKTIVDESEQKLLTAINNGSVYSLDSFLRLTASGNLKEVGDNLSKLFEHISIEHPLFPNYGFTWEHGALISAPRTKEAVKLFPPKYLFTGHVRAGDQYFNDPSVDILNYAYRHQVRLEMEVSEARKYLGDILDPSQAEVEKMPGHVLYAIPPAFPPAFPCSIMVGGTVFFSYILMRTQEILDDNTIIISNREQTDCTFYFELRINPSQRNSGQIKMRMNNASNRDHLLNLRFIQELITVKMLRFHVLEADTDIFACNIDNIDYETGFPSIDCEIDFMDKVCTIEDRFHVSLHIDNVIMQREYDLVMYLSDLIREEMIISTWDSADFTGVIDGRLRRNILTMDDTPMAITYVGNTIVTLWKTDLSVEFMRTYKSACIKEIERIKELVNLLKDGDTIKITFIPGSDNTLIDTMNIPECFRS